MQGSAVRDSAPLLFFCISDSFASPAGDQIQRENEGRPRQDEVKKRRCGIPAGGKGGSGDEGGSGLDSKVEWRKTEGDGSEITLIKWSTPANEECGEKKC